MGGRVRSVHSKKKKRHIVSGKRKMTDRAVLFVPGWEWDLTLCQLAERPIQKKKKKISCVSIPKIITHSILPQTHTLQTWQQLKEIRSVCVCVCA